MLEPLDLLVDPEFEGAPLLELVPPLRELPAAPPVAPPEFFCAHGGRFGSFWLWPASTLTTEKANVENNRTDLILRRRMADTLGWVAGMCS